MKTVLNRLTAVFFAFVLIFSNVIPAMGITVDAANDDETTAVLTQLDGGHESHEKMRFTDQENSAIRYALPDGFTFADDAPSGVQLKEIGGYYSDRLASSFLTGGTFNPSPLIDAMNEDQAYKLVYYTVVMDEEGHESFLFEERTVTKAELEEADAFTFTGDIYDVMYPDHDYSLFLESNIGRYSGDYHQILTNVPDFYDITMYKVDGSDAFLMNTDYSQDDQTFVPDVNLVELTFERNGEPSGVYEIHARQFSDATLQSETFSDEIKKLHLNPSEAGIQYSVITQDDGEAAWKKVFETGSVDYQDHTVIEVSGTDAFTFESLSYEADADRAYVSAEILGDTGHLLQSVWIYNAGYYGEDADLDIWSAMGIRDQRWTMLNFNLQFIDDMGKEAAFFDGGSVHRRMIDHLPSGTYSTVFSVQNGLDSVLELAKDITVEEDLYRDLVFPDGFEAVRDHRNQVTLTDSSGDPLTYSFPAGDAIDLDQALRRMNDDDVYSMMITGQMREIATGDKYIYTIEETVSSETVHQIDVFNISGDLHAFAFPDSPFQANAVTDLTRRGTNFEGVSGIYTDIPEAFNVLFTDTSGTSLSILRATYQEDERLYEVEEGERNVFNFEQNEKEIGIYGVDHYFEGTQIELYAASLENQFTQLITNAEGQHIRFKHLANEGAEDPWIHEFGYTYYGPGEKTVNIPDNKDADDYHVDVEVFDSGLSVFMTSNEKDAYFLQSGILPQDGEYSEDIFDLFDEHALARRFAYAKATVEVFDEAGSLVTEKTTTMPTSYSLPPMDDGHYEIVTTIPMGSEERLVLSRDVYIGDPFAEFDTDEHLRVHIDGMVTLPYTAGGKDLLFRVMGEEGNSLYHEWTGAYNSVISKTAEFTFLSTGVYTFQIVHAGEVLDSVDVTVYEGDLHLAYEGDTDLTVEYGSTFELPEVKVMYGDEVQGKAEVTITEASGDEVPKVDTSVPGEYTLEYHYTSEDGTEASLQITVTVLEEISPVVPALHYEGDTELSVEYGSTFELPEVKVMYGDEEQGKAEVTVTEASGDEVPRVDTTVPGEYTLEYHYTSEDGTKASPVTITVTVLEEAKDDEPTFTDLTEGYRFYDEIAFLSGMEVINGYLDGSFAPDDTVTRAAAATMIGRALELDGTQRDTDFPDVRDGNNASGFIQAAAELEIIQGFPDGSFRPNEPVTRGQMAIFIARAFDMETQAEMDFTDMVPSMAAYDSVGMILRENITQGFPDGTYRPDDAVTRGQFSAFLSRTLDETFR